MRRISPNVIQLLDTHSFSTFVLVELNTATPYRHTSLAHNVEVETLGLFLADNGLTGAEPPKLSGDVDREAYKIVYTDPSFEFREIFDNGLVGARLSVWFGFINTLDEPLGGAMPGEPLLGIGDIVKSYQGVVDSHGYNIDVEKITMSIEGSSPMADLNLVKSLYTSKDALRQLGVVDTAFDQVYRGSKVVNLLWGKT